MKKQRTHDEHGPRHVTPAGHSVFYDLGFDEAEARVLEMRADLIAALREHIQKRLDSDSGGQKSWGSLSRGSQHSRRAIGGTSARVCCSCWQRSWDFGQR
jgi:hypothetical protein